MFACFLASSYTNIPNVSVSTFHSIALYLAQIRSFPFGPLVNRDESPPSYCRTPPHFQSLFCSPRATRSNINCTIFSLLSQQPFPFRTIFRSIYHAPFPLLLVIPFYFRYNFFQFSSLSQSRNIILIRNFYTALSPSQPSRSASSDRVFSSLLAAISKTAADLLTHPVINR